MKLQTYWCLLKETASKWSADNVPRLGAALAFYTMLSAAPLLVVATTIGGLVFGPDAVQGQLAHQMQDLMGKEGAESAQTMLANAYHPTTGIIASIIGIVVLLVGATGVFAELQSSLNLIWKAPASATGAVLGFLRERLFSFLMVLGIGFLLLVSLVASTLLTAVGNWLGGGTPDLLWHAINLVVSVGVITLLFAMIYKLLPQVHINWRDVWVGAFLTAVLFNVGKFLIGLYLGSSGMGTSYGKAGSLAVFLVWVYYSSQIVFFGAEFTYVYAHGYGSRKDAAPDSDGKAAGRQEVQGRDVEATGRR